MKRFVMIAGLSLSSCAGTTPPPAVEVRTQTVVKEVAKPCPVRTPVRPAPLARPLPSDAVALAALLGSKLSEWAAPGGFGDQALKAIATCQRAGAPNVGKSLR